MLSRKLLFFVFFIGLAAVLPQQVFANPVVRIAVQGGKRVAAEAVERGGGAGARALARETVEQAGGAVTRGAVGVTRETLDATLTAAIRRGVPESLGRSFEGSVRHAMSNAYHKYRPLLNELDTVIQRKVDVEFERVLLELLRNVR